MPERLKASAGAIMSRDVPTLARDASVADAVRLLLERGASCAVVVEEGNLPSGIITERDLLPMATEQGGGLPGLVLRQILQDERHILDFLQQARKAHASRVADVMSSPVQCADIDMTVGQVAAIMEAFDYRQLPVVREGRLVGLVTRHDIVRAIADKT